MSKYLLYLTCLLCTNGLAQSLKPNSQRSDTEVKGNTDKITVVEAGTVITYNLLNEKEKQQFLAYLRSLSAIDIYELVNKAGLDDTVRGNIYNNLGEAYYQNGESDKALEYFNETLQITMKVFGPEHPDVATTYNNLGMACSQKGEMDKAIEYYNKSLPINLDVLGPDHPHVATAYNNLGAVYRYKGEVDKAIEYYTKALVIIQKVLGSNHPDTVNIAEAIESLRPAKKK